MWNVFKNNQRDTITLPLVTWWCLYCKPWTCFLYLCSCIFVVYFKHVQKETERPSFCSVFHLNWNNMDIYKQRPINHRIVHNNHKKRNRKKLYFWLPCTVHWVQRPLHVEISRVIIFNRWYNCLHKF